jgi:sensor histidine kinase YesM
MRFYITKLYLIYMAVFISLISVFAVIAIDSTYKLNRNELLYVNDQVIDKVCQKLVEKSDHFWKNYMPMYYTVANKLNFFVFFTADAQELAADPSIKQNISGVLRQVMMLDNDIACIILKRSNEKRKAYLFSDSQVSEVTDAELSYLPMLEENPVKRILPLTMLAINGNPAEIYAISGGSPIFINNRNAGTMIVCYYAESTYEFRNQLKNITGARCFAATESGKVVCLLQGQSPSEADLARIATLEGNSVVIDGQKNYIQKVSYARYGIYVCYMIPWDELQKLAHTQTPSILFFCTAMIILLAFSNRIISILIFHRVNSIGKALEGVTIANWNAEIPLGKGNDEFDIITRKINGMICQLRNAVETSYEYELKCKTAELRELQARLNPHFLYNTLDSICARAQESGNSDLEEMLIILSRLLRNYINRKPFVTIREELTACSLYIDLFKLRYSHNVHILIDADPRVMDYGIIRNMLQPLVENYFLHGYIPDKTDNLLEISMRLRETGLIEITVNDNGAGITEERLRELGTREGYGLKNIHDRVRIFYGDPCMLNISPRPEGGVTVKLVIRAMSLEEHEKNLNEQDQSQ